MKRPVTVPFLRTPSMKKALIFEIARTGGPGRASSADRRTDLDDARLFA
jgi:hypothetical protein